MNILINAISAKKGGIVTYTTNLVRALEQRGVDFHVAVPHAFPDSPHVVRVDASDYKPLRRLAWEQTVWRTHVMRRRPDILFSSANFGLLGCPVPQVLLVREGGLFDPFYLSTIAPQQGAKLALQRYLRRQLMLWSTSGTTHVITPTAAMRDMLLDWVPALEPRCSVNTYGTLLDSFQPADPPRPWRGDGTLRLLYVSVYYAHKNPGCLALATEQLNAEGIPAHALCTMTLDETQRMPGGAYDHFVLSRAQASGAMSLQAFPYAQLPGVYTSHDVFVFPSVSETFGHPMVEAMSSGLPIVAADTPVNREVCGDCALYFRPFSASELAARIKELDADPALRARLSQAARQRSLKAFGWQDHVDRLLEIFKSLKRRNAP